MRGERRRPEPGGGAHPGRAGLRSRLSGGPGVAGPLRPPRLQQLPGARPQPGRGLHQGVGRAGLGGRRDRVLPARGEGRGRPLLARSRPAPHRAPAASRRRPGARARRLPRARPRDPARRAHALRAPHPRAGGARRVPDGDPRQLSASLRAAAAARVRGPRARRGLVAVAPPRPRPPAGVRARRFPPVEPAVPRRDRLLGAGPEPWRMGRAGRRRERARHQLPLLRAPEGRARGPAGRRRAVRHALPRVPRGLCRRCRTTASCSR